MVHKVFSRDERQQQLMHLLEEEPFCTDEEFAKYFGVSIQSIRLDRLALGVPELRQRIRSVAQVAYERVRSLSANELMGELIDLELGKNGISVLEITPDMVLTRTGIARGHYLFAQANSLAVAVIDDQMVLTGSARVRYKRPVYLKEKVLAKANVKAHKGNKYLVSVYSKVESEIVFKGQFIVSAQNGQASREA